jgi:hypothetical protein
MHAKCLIAEEEHAVFRSWTGLFETKEVLPKTESRRRSEAIVFKKEFSSVSKYPFRHAL